MPVGILSRTVMLNLNVGIVVYSRDDAILDGRKDRITTGGTCKFYIASC